MYKPETSSSSLRQDSHRDSSPKRSNQDSSTRRASEKHVINWSDRHLSTLHNEPIDPMRHEAMIAGRYSNQTDQRASTSGSGLEHGGLGQAEDMQQLSRKLICEVFKRLETSTFISIYRALDSGYKLFRILDDRKRQEVIRQLKTIDIVGTL